jgi:uroporphyrinogen decarboxylase
MMTSSERFLAAVEHKTPDRIPLDLGVGHACLFNREFYKSLLNYFGIKEDIVTGATASLTVIASESVLQRLECDVRCGYPFFAAKVNDMSGASTGEKWEDDKYYYLTDSFGTSLRMPKDGGHYYDMYKSPLEGADESEDAKYEWPEAPKVNPEGVANAKKYRDAGYPVVIDRNMGNGFLQHGPRVYGYIDWFSMLATEEARVNRFLDKLLETKIKFFDSVIDGFGDLLDVIIERDDLGTQNAPFISREMFLKYMKPRWKILFDHIKKRTKAKIFFHSDGAMSIFIPDLIEVGIDILNPVQISCNGMDPGRIKKEFGKDLSFWGAGIDTQYVLPFGTVKEVKENVKRNIDAMRKDGGFIFSTVHNVQAGVPLENFLAMWETFLENRNY